jgi:hypothetical protein
MTGTVEQLWAAYGDWKTFTEQEGLAIDTADWPRVRQIQEEKRALQAQIIHLTEQAQHQFSAPFDHDFDTRLRAIVNELILLETQNNLTLQGTLEHAREQKNRLEATSSRLRQLHNSYVPSRHPVWENFS